MNFSRSTKGIIMLIGVLGSQITIQLTATPGLSNITKTEQFGT